MDIPASLLSVLGRFPNRKETAKRLLKESETFQALCEDHRKCAEALRHWCRSDLEEADARTDEYTALLVDLEMEIMQSLNEWNV